MTNAAPPPPLLVGSIAGTDAASVFDAIAGTLGHNVHCVPDGETGPRANWIGWQHGVFARLDALERIDAPQRDYQLGAPYRLRAGAAVADIDFGDIGFAREALASYEIFVKRRDNGKFAPDSRFQLCLPTPFAPVYSFVAYESQGDLYPLYERAVVAELDRVCAAVPSQDLAVQWDVATEMSIFEGLHPVPFLGDDPEPRLIDILARLGDAVPAGVEMGYHLCYGSMNNKHWKEPLDLGVCTGTANSLAAKIARRIDWVHVPVPVARDDDAYFAPLDILRLAPETTLYLGLIHLGDGVEGVQRRSAAARRHIARFGIATECGLGRYSAEDAVSILRLYRDLAGK